MFVPVVARLDNLGLDGRKDLIERLDGVLVWCMGLVEVEFLLRCCVMKCRRRVSTSDMSEHDV